MLVIFVVGAPLAERYVESAGLSAFDPAQVADDLQRGALLRDVQMMVQGQYSGTPAPELEAGAQSLRVGTEL